MQHPYHDFGSSTQRFVEEAAADPSVAAIKATLYRTNSDSPIIIALLKAAEHGKQAHAPPLSAHKLTLHCFVPYTHSPTTSTGVLICRSNSIYPGGLGRLP